MEFFETVSTRQNAGVDPTLHVWGWEIPVYLFLGGLAAGMLVLSAAMELHTRERPRSGALRWAPLLALAAISVGMGALFLDLENQWNVWRFYTTFRPGSPMSWGAWILVLVYPVGVLHGLGSLPEGRRTSLSGRLGAAGPLLLRLAAWSDSVRRPVLWATVVLGAGLGLYTGLLLGTAPARVLWNTPVLGPLFLVSGLSTGAAVLLLFPLDEDEHARLARWDVAAIVTELALLGLLLVGFARGGAAQRGAVEVLLGGEWTASFWSLVVVMGLLTPLALGAVELRQHRPATRLAPVLVLLGGFALRAILVSAGQETSLAMLP